MKGIGLSAQEIELMRSVFGQVEAIREVLLYGSRAQGTHRPESDVDLALVGVEDPLQAEAIAEELDELAMPYRFDVRAYGSIRYESRSASTSPASAFLCIGGM